MSETRLDTNYISYTKASYRTIMPYIECDIERLKVNFQTQSNAENHFMDLSPPFLKKRQTSFCRGSHCHSNGLQPLFVSLIVMVLWQRQY